jgi:peptidoglycan/LPS O-acetylase OafA/YrhL
LYSYRKSSNTAVRGKSHRSALLPQSHWVEIPRTSRFAIFAGPVNRTTVKRLLWLDVAKGIAILIVVYFHFFKTYFEHGSLPIIASGGLFAAAMTFLGKAWLKVSDAGFHAVGAFIILGGWALMEATARRADAGPISWGTWYRARFLRLYPMYWLAHIVYLISPFVARLEPVDGRIVLSLLGLRFIDITMNFMYLNAAWWYFSMLIQFYLLFPILFWAARKLGPWPFLLIACAIGFLVRYWMLVIHPLHGFWILGGCAICRLPEFALGMTLGVWHSRSAARMEKCLLGGAGLLAGLLLYPAAVWLYHNGTTYTFVDLATGGCALLVILGLAGLISRFSNLAKVFALVGSFSYGIYLVHQPYVIWLGLRIREQPIWMFFIITIVTLGALSAWGIFLEKGMNRLLSNLGSGGDRSRPMKS